LIFVTVGSMLPFDRLVRSMDAWAALHPDETVFAQIGASAFLPGHMGWERLLPPSEYRRCVAQAALLVSHAGMGSVITAREMGKPIIILPRLEERREVTTNHQVATAHWLRGKPGIFVASSESELAGLLGSIPRGSAHGQTAAVPSSQQLIRRIRSFIEQ